MVGEGRKNKSGLRNMCTTFRPGISIFLFRAINSLFLEMLSGTDKACFLEENMLLQKRNTLVATLQKNSGGGFLSRNCGKLNISVQK